MDYFDLLSKTLLKDLEGFTYQIEEFTDMLYEKKKLNNKEEIVKQINILREITEEVTTKFNLE